MNYNADLVLAEKLLQSYYLTLRKYTYPLTDDFFPDKGLRKMINSQTDYNRLLQNMPEMVKENTIYRIEDAFFCVYLFFMLPETEGPQFACIGPYHTVEVTQKEILSLSNSISLSPSKVAQLQKFYENIPLIEDESPLLNILFVLGEYMWGSMNNFHLQDARSFLTSELEFLQNVSDEDPQEALLSMKLLEERYDLERKLMQAVSQGQTHKAEMQLGHFQAMQIERRTSDSLRNKKNYSIILNTLLRKAAESGAVHPLHIDTLSSRFAKKIESAVSISAVSVIDKEMVHKYCLLVKNHSMKGYSLLVRKVLTRIDSDLTADLSLHAQAELLNVNSSYLSTLFKKETGVTLTDYVNKKRVDHAIFLLNTTNMQIQSIAQYCGIPDVNYFTKTFKKYIGKTPKEYRDLIAPYKGGTAPQK